MSDELNPAPAEPSPRKSRIARRVFIGSALLGGAGWWLSGKIQEARWAAQRSGDK